MSEFSEKLEEFKSVKHKVKTLIDLFPPENRDEVLFDKWTLKDVVAHLNHWMEDDLHALNNLVQGKKSYWYPDVEQFNKEGVDKRKGYEMIELSNFDLPVYAYLVKDTE